jgi:hypothetical protein
MQRKYLKTMNRTLYPLLCGWLLVSLPWADCAAQQLTTYRATYDLFYKGRHAGTSEFSVTEEPADEAYRFVSNSRLRGIIGRLVAPHPVLEDSRFVVNAGQIRPAAFHYEDGSRKGEDNYTVAFDWDAGVARVTTDDGPREFPLEGAVLDRGTSQVAAMFDAARGATPPTYRIIGDDGIEVYDVAELAPAATTTGLGEMQTRRFSHHRNGSSRMTVLWLASELRFLPVRIEQLRDGEARTVFVLQSVDFD